MTPRRLLVDQDGPLAAFDRSYWSKVADLGLRCDVPYGPEHQRHRYATDHLPRRRDRSLIRSFIEGPGWFRDLEVTAGATDGMARLLDAADDAGLEVWICTKPLDESPTCVAEKRAWVAEHFPDLIDRFIAASDKSTVDGECLLDDAPQIEWLPRAPWEPVIFPTGFNGAGSKWAGIRRWTWGDPLHLLHPDLDAR